MTALLLDAHATFICVDFGALDLCDFAACATSTPLPRTASTAMTARRVLRRTGPGKKESPLGWTTWASCALPASHGRRATLDGNPGLAHPQESGRVSDAPTSERFLSSAPRSWRASPVRVGVGPARGRVYAEHVPRRPLSRIPARHLRVP